MERFIAPTVHWQLELVDDGNVIERSEAKMFTYGELVDYTFELYKGGTGQRLNIIFNNDDNRYLFIDTVKVNTGKISLVNDVLVDSDKTGDGVEWFDLGGSGFSFA